jgi:peptidyl-prolyl cis-trans isomerase D
MSSPLRRRRGGAIIWIVMALLIFGLAGFGVTSFSGGQQSIGSAGGRDIPINDYVRELQREMNAVSAQLGQPVTFAQAQALGIDRAVQSRLFAGAALDNEAARMGVSVGDAEVHRTLVSAPAFQGPDGSFDRNAYRLFIEREGMSEAAFEERLRSEAGRAILQGAVTGAVAMPSVFARRIAEFAGEERSFTLAELIASDLPEPVPDATEAEARAFYDANPDAFMRPETRNITYIWLSPETVAETVEVDEAALREAYDARIEEFVVPERRLVERLVFPNAEDAQTALARIESGAVGFADIVAERGLTLADIDLGEQSKESLGAAGEAVFALDEPGVVGPIDTDLGPALFAMNAILEAQETSFEDARDDLTAEVRTDRARRQISDRAHEIEDLIASGATLEEVAAEAGMTLGAVAFNDETTGELAGYAEFREAALAATEDGFPELIALDDGGVFALRLDGIDPAAVRPFEDVRDGAAEGWRRAETHKRLLALADGIKARLDGGETLESLGLVTTRFDRFARGGFISDAPAEVAGAVFAAEAGAHQIVDAQNRVLVFTLREIHPATLSDPDVAGTAEQVGAQADQGLAQDVFEYFTMGLESGAGITLDQAAINAVHSQFP